MSAPYPFPYKSVACTFLLLWVFVFLFADLFAGSFRTLGIKEGLGSRQVFQINKDSAGFVWVYIRGKKRCVSKFGRSENI